MQNEIFLMTNCESTLPCLIICKSIMCLYMYFMYCKITMPPPPPQGKWTTYRSMAEELVDRAVIVGGLNNSRGCQTNGYTLEGSDGWCPTDFIRLVQDYGVDVDVCYSCSFYSAHSMHMAVMLYCTSACNLASLSITWLWKVQFENKNGVFVPLYIFYNVTHRLLLGPFSTFTPSIAFNFYNKKDP